MTAAMLSEFMPYGAPELQDAARPHMARALALSSLLGSLAFALAWWLSLVWVSPQVARPQPDPPVVELDPRDILILPPPALTPPATPPAPTDAVAAIPVPVPDPQAGPSATLPSQEDLGAVAPPSAGAEGSLTIETPATEGPVNLPGEIALVDQYPAAVRAVQPLYPEIARQAGVEGLVKVNVLVGKDGRVLEARVDPAFSVVMLDAAALEAARKWVFTPALVNNHPVQVWVALPFRFRLR